MGITMRRGALAVVVLAVAAALVAPVSVSSPETATAEAEPLVDTVVERPDVVYGWARDHAGRGQRLRMDLWLPTATRGRRPAVILAHGGGFYSGHRKNNRIRALAASLAERGYVTASISYRLTPTRRTRGMALVRSGAARDAQHDVQAAVRFLRSEARQFRIDKRRIGALGTSAGGIAVLRAAHNPGDPGHSGHRRYRSRVDAVVSLWGAGDHRRIGRRVPPTMMFHGREDRVVPFWAARKTCATTRRRGGTCWNRWWWAERHSPWHRAAEIEHRAARFLDRKL